MKALTKPLLFLALLFAGLATANAQPELYIDGVHYESVDSPVRTVDPNKIEVTEVFWYGCPHCYAFEPLLESWVEKLPADVVFVRSPGMWNEIMEVHAQIYYAAEALGVFAKVHPVAFSEIHQKGNYLEGAEQVKALFVAQGVSEADFDKTWSSFGVTSAVKQAGTRMRDYGIRGVPNLIVNGKYRITVGDGVPSQADMLKVAEFLIQKERNG